jgi:hypothetical protein
MFAVAPNDSPVDGRRGTSLETSFTVIRYLDGSMACNAAVTTGTRTAWPTNKTKRATFPRPMARNPMKLINNKGRYRKAKRSVERISASIGIPTVLY